MPDSPATEPRNQLPSNGGAGWYRFRPVVSLGVHLALFAISLLMAFGIAYNFHGIFPSTSFSIHTATITKSTGWFLTWYLPLLIICLPCKAFAFLMFRQYRISWRYVGLRDLLGMASASYVGSMFFMVAFFSIASLFPNLLEERTLQNNSGFRQAAVFLSDMVGTIGLVAIVRMGWRLYHEEVRRIPQDGYRRPVLVIGADRAGETVVREIIRSGEQQEVVGFLDDVPNRLHNRIHGIEVLGPTSIIREVIEENEVEEVLIALPGAPPREIRRIVEQCQGMSVSFRTIPEVSDLITGRVEISTVRDVSIEDLLGRPPVSLDVEAIGDILAGKRIVVTGAGGSIGSEMCRQIAKFGPKRLVLVEQAENNLFEIDRELRRAHPDLDVIPRIADICDATRVKKIFWEETPSAVFHAAAHKHVPMMEINFGEAIKNNVVGTRTIADAAVECGLKKMVMISTDKAVNPTSIMGCTKRVAELYVQQLSSRTDTQFVTVRFGNVLGSSGSVVPIFKKQIAAGGPVTVTHPEMIRYFMTIPEASQLVLEAGTMGNGGEIYVLDMGDPVKIVDLARDMIQLSGLRPNVDIDIEFSGVRPGEKLFEELSVAGEDMGKTKHPKIYAWKHRPEDWDTLCNGIAQLVSLADDGDKDAIQAQLKTLVPEFQPEAGGANPTKEAVRANNGVNGNS